MNSQFSKEVFPVLKDLKYKSFERVGVKFDSRFSLINGALRESAFSNPSTYTEIYNILYPAVFYFALGFVEHFDAEDIAADAFSKLWMSDKCFENIHQVKIFLQISVRNAAINLNKHLKVRARVQEYIEKSTVLETEDLKFDKEVRAIQLRLIMAEIDNLPPKRKIIFRLYYFDGLKEAEIAKKMRLAVGTVHNQKLRALKQVRMAVLRNPLLVSLCTLMSLI